MSNRHRATPTDPVARLDAWVAWAETEWYDLPNGPGLGCFGTGYNAWGVQTNQKYLAGAATVARLGSPGQRARARARAIAALRFSLRSHVSGGGHCTDGTPWGHTWISALGIERMMHGVHLLDAELEDADRDGLRTMLESEADWLLTDYRRGGIREIVGDVWNASGRNAPESNLWNGALLWRTAVTYPDHPHAADWQERAHRFLINAVSIASDAADATLVADKPVRERHAGANFFPHYALDHHGYLNVGYLVICLSNAAMLHFDLKAAGLPRPETLDHHQPDLWAVLRRMIFADGRLARIGGDTRHRYAYCQEYLLPALLYAADRFGDPHARGLAERQLKWVGIEADANGDGSFYGRRMAPLAKESPYYYTRLESDRACALSQYLAYVPLVDGPPPADPGAEGADFERSVAGGWEEPEHGAVLHRSDLRLASFSWRAYGGPAGLCLPPDDGSLAEWEGNLTGRIDFACHRHAVRPLPQRRLIGAEVHRFDGGFLTWGSFHEGAELELAEGWRHRDAAVHQVAFAALPDGRTVVGIQFAVLGGLRAWIKAVQGLHLVVANDVYNGSRRVLQAENGGRLLEGPPAADELLALGSTWANWDDRLGILGIYGAGELVLDRSARRRAGRCRSLHTEELSWPNLGGPRWFAPGEVLLDAGWAILSGVNAEATRAAARAPAAQRLPAASPLVRLVRVEGADGGAYAVAANFGDEDAELTAADWPALPNAVDLVRDGPVRAEVVAIPARTAAVFGACCD